MIYFFNAPVVNVSVWPSIVTDASSPAGHVADAVPFVNDLFPVYTPSYLCSGSALRADAATRKINPNIIPETIRRGLNVECLQEIISVPLPNLAFIGYGLPSAQVGQSGQAACRSTGDKSARPVR